MAEPVFVFAAGTPRWFPTRFRTGVRTRTFRRKEFLPSVSLHEVDRHYEHIDLTEAEIEHRAAFPKEPLEEEIGRVLLYEELHKRIAQLTETQQRRLALYYFHGLTYEQIAAAEGCRYQAVRDSVRSAIQKLKNFMSE